MKMSDLRRYSVRILQRFGRFPLLRPVITFLYKRAVSCDILQYSVQAAQEKVLAMSPRPKGRSCWQAPGKETGGYDLSVIIPFYKTEQYAKACIDSVMSQVCDYRVEVILVNDGSPDGCGRILDTYAPQENVVILHQENQGLAAARNAGIAVARGEYLLFVDSDDLMAEGAIQALMNAARAHDADIVEGSHQIMTVDGKPQRTYRKTANVSVQGEGMFGYAWGKVFRKELFYHVCFPEGYWYEDTVIANLIYPIAGTTAAIPDLVAFYRINPKGLTASGTGNPRSVDTLYVVEDILNTYETLQIPLTERGREQLIMQLGPYLVRRVQWMDEDSIQALFVMASDIAHRSHLLLPQKTGNFFYDELCEALAQGQYHRWKWASMLV